MFVWEIALHDYEMVARRVTIRAGLRDGGTTRLGDDIGGPCDLARRSEVRQELL